MFQTVAQHALLVSLSPIPDQPDALTVRAENILQLQQPNPALIVLMANIQLLLEQIIPAPASTAMPASFMAGSEHHPAHFVKTVSKVNIPLLWELLLPTPALIVLTTSTLQLWVPIQVLPALTVLATHFHQPVVSSVLATWGTQDQLQVHA